MKGIFLVIEGADGSGKTAQAQRLAARLGEVVTDLAHVIFPGDRPPVLLTREPSDGPVGCFIRAALTGRVELASDAMGPLFMADRADHVAREIRPALDAGAMVVCDRYHWSNVVYRAAETEGPLYACITCGWEGDPEASLGPLQTCPVCRATAAVAVHPRVWALAAWVRSWEPDLLVPDLTVVLAVPPGVAAQRRQARGGVVERYDGGRMQARCCALYGRAVELAGGREPVAVVDGVGAEDDVAARVWCAVAGVVGEKGAA